MHAIPRLLVDLALVLGVGALTSLIFRWLRLPVLLGYVLAGLVVGPHVPVPLVADLGNVHTLADLGVTLLMFSIGLEFSLQRLFRAGPTALLMGSIQVGSGVALGAWAARALGWTPTEALFLGAALSISSTMVLAKLFEEHPPSRALRETVLSVLVVQDLFAILLLTALTTYARVGGLHASELGWKLARLVGLLGGGLLLARLGVPRLLRWVADHGRPESLLVASAGLCFAMAVGAAAAGFSLALGAFLAGMLAAESGRARAIDRLVRPLRDLFSAIFFVAVGMLLDPAAASTHVGTVLLLALLVAGGNALSLLAGGVLAGLPFGLALRTGLALGQIGEFGFIMLGVGVAAGVVRGELYSVGVGVAVATILLTPQLLGRSGRWAEVAEARLPERLRSTLGLYQAWAASLRQRGIRKGEGRDLRRPALYLLLDSLLLLLMAVGHRMLQARLALLLEAGAPLGHALAQGLAAGLLGFFGALLLLGILGQGRVLARRLAVLAPNPEVAGSGRRGRHLLAGGLRLGVLLMVGLPLVALLQVVAPRGPLLGVSLVVFGGTLLLMLVRAKRQARELRGGSEWLLARVRDPLAPEEAPRGAFRALRLGPACPSLGRPLSELDLPGRAGVTVVALLRDGDRPLPLQPSPELRAGDLLALAGPEAALDEAEALLGAP